jgi:hypothetical protein
LDDFHSSMLPTPGEPKATKNIGGGT